MIVYHGDGKPSEAFPRRLVLQERHGPLVDLTGSTLRLSVQVGAEVVVFLPINVLGQEGLVAFEPGDAFLEGLPERYSFDLEWTNPAGEIRTVVAETVERGPSS